MEGRLKAIVTYPPDTLEGNREAFDYCFDILQGEVSKEQEKLIKEAQTVLCRNGEQLRKHRLPRWKEITGQKMLKAKARTPKKFFCHKCKAQFETSRDIVGRACHCGKGFILEGYVEAEMPKG